MVRAVAYVPGSPLLVPGLGGQADVLAHLRETCLEAVRALGPGPVVVVGEGPEDAWYGGGRARFDAYGPTGSDVFCCRYRGREEIGEQSDPLPLALGVGLSLAVSAHADVCGLLAVAAQPELTVEGAAALLVVADGSARRGPQAPLPADPRAEAWDDALAAALGRGDLNVDVDLGAELGAPAAVWQAAAALTAGRRWDARLLAHEAPLGVAYLVATWR